MSEATERTQEQAQLGKIGIEVDESRERVRFNYDAADPKKVYDLDLGHLADYFYNVKDPRTLTDRDVALCVQYYMDAGLEEKGGPWADIYSLEWQMQNPGQVKRFMQLERYLASFLRKPEEEAPQKTAEAQARIPVMVEESTGPSPLETDPNWKEISRKSSKRTGNLVRTYRNDKDRTQEYVLITDQNGKTLRLMRIYTPAQKRLGS